MSAVARRSLLSASGLLTVGAGLSLAAPALAWDVAKLGPSTLRPGDTGWYVKQLQWAVNKVGNVPTHLTVDGVYGYTTTRAVKEFQSRQGLYVDGIAGSATKGRLDALLDVLYPDAPTEPAPGGNAPDLLQPRTSFASVGSGWTIRPGDSGTRVKLVLRRLGIYQGELLHKMTTEAVDAVKRFQARSGLYADGLVGPRTWAAMGLASSTFYIDGWQQQPKVGLSATPSQRIEAMIAFARAQQGADYTWGGAGPYRYGFDCSGLVLQSMGAGGVRPDPITVRQHQSPGFRTTRNLYAHDRLRHVPLSQRKRGDLVWYTNASGYIQHVAIYLGSGYVVDSLYTVRVRQDSSRLSGYYRLGTVSRVFA